MKGNFFCSALLSIARSFRRGIHGEGRTYRGGKNWYDPAVISYDDLLTVFFNTHDPTTLNRQGNDIGPQYRSAIFCTDPTEKEKAEALIKELNDTKAYVNPVVTEVLPLGAFYEAEDYHHDYYERNKDKPYCQFVIRPKLEKLQKHFTRLIK